MFLCQQVRIVMERCYGLHSLVCSDSRCHWFVVVVNGFSCLRFKYFVMIFGECKVTQLHADAHCDAPVAGGEVVDTCRYRLKPRHLVTQHSLSVPRGRYVFCRWVRWHIYLLCVTPVMVCVPIWVVVPYVLMYASRGTCSQYVCSMC